jgi:hypothetical protein
MREEVIAQERRHAFDLSKPPAFVEEHQVTNGDRKHHG